MAMAMANSPKPSDAKMSSLPKYGWDEVKKHNSREDCWIVIERTIEGEKRGIILDITQWAPKHPGGSIIYDGAGGDCTVMFWCYHPINFVENSSGYINKYAVGEVENYNCVYNLDSPLLRTLKRRMEAMIPRKDRCHDPRLWWKTAFILLCIATFFYLGWVRGSIPFIVLYGVAMAQSCINIMHDGIHTSYSKYTWLNGLAAWTFNLCGANFLAYRRVHTYGHHAYTCHDEYDSSIPRSYPVVKLHDKLESKWFNKFQHFYVWLVLSLGTVHFWWGDFGEMSHFWNYPRRKGHITPFQWFYVISGKLIFFYWYFYLQFSWFPWQQALLHCAIFQSTSSLTSIVFFAVNHWTDKAVMVNAEEMLKNTKDWVVNQVISSTNFSRKSWFWTQFSGGLNLQIEHHIFPQLVHTRLPDISDMVRETLMEFGLDYDQQCYPTFTSSLWGMYNWLRGVGCDYPLKPYPKLSDPQPLVEKKKHA